MKSGTTYDLYSISFVNDNAGWAVGEYGKIYYYNGTSWKGQASGTGNNLMSVSFIDTKNGWAVGTSGVLLKYDGVQWNPQISGTNNTLNSVCFIDDYTGWAAGVKGTILNTNNGGITPLWFNLIGYVQYDDINLSPLDSVRILLETAGFEILDTAYTVTTGKYIFRNLQPGEYIMELSSKNPWRGATPVDALLINRYYIKAYKFNDYLEQEAADVNKDGKITPADALLINRRYIHSIKSFKAGSWVFESPDIIIEDGNLNVNIKGVCYGDVSGAD